MAFDPTSFRSVLGRFASGVTVVTARDGEQRDYGMTVTAFSSLSLAPPLVLICVEEHTRMHRVLLSASQFAVNILGHSQEPLARRFSEPCDDRFGGVGYTRGVTGAALLNDTLAFVECDLAGRHPGGDHTIFIGEVIAGEVRPARPLLYYRGGYTPMER